MTCSCLDITFPPDFRLVFDVRRMKWQKAKNAAVSLWTISDVVAEKKKKHLNQLFYFVVEEPTSQVEPDMVCHTFYLLFFC